MDSEANRNKPAGVRFIEFTKGSEVSLRTFKILVLSVTFLAYAAYHATRKTTSIVKSSLNTPKDGWIPFDGPEGMELLGGIDVGFLSAYAIGIFFSGHIGDRMDIRIFLTIGMVGTGIFSALFGIGYWANIHSFYYYLIVQILAGLFQSTGWPSVIAVVGNWFGKKKRGLIMGIWNSHTSIGNITGSIVASILLKNGWGWSMVVPGLGIMLVGVVVFLLLPVSPSSVGTVLEKNDGPPEIGDEEPVDRPLLDEDIMTHQTHQDQNVGFLEAWKIPGVVPFAVCLFFAKLVAYTFLYWLPFYISHTAIDGKYLTDEESGNLSTLFDVGGVIGGILAGYVSDRLDARAITAASFMYCAIPALYLYKSYGHISTKTNIIFMMITGVFVNGPYSLITTAVSADLGTHSSLKGNSRALATVTAIIDGTGSIGAAVGPLLTGYISARSWSAVFYVLMVSTLIAGLLLTGLVKAEVAEKIRGSGSQEDSTSTSIRDI